MRNALRPIDFVDFVARLAFFATAPFALVLIAALFPVTGALVQVGLALAVFFAGAAARGWAKKSKLARLLLGNMLRFEDYYRTHRPRPFLYYVLYPLLFPYWLFVRDARREFLLFKGYTLVSFTLLVVSLARDYRTSCPPELDVRAFLPIAGGTLLAEAVVVLSLLMPIATSVVHFHAAHAPKRLATLLLVGAVSVGVAVYRLERPRDPVVSYATRMRLRLREAAKPKLARDYATRALRAAWLALPQNRRDVDSDGKVLGAPLEAAHTALAGFYKHDEAEAFDLWYQRSKKGAVLVVYFEARDKRPPIWLAMDGALSATHDPVKLPQGAFRAMKLANDSLE